MTRRVLVVNGPDLGRLGTSEPAATAPPPTPGGRAPCRARQGARLRGRGAGDQRREASDPLARDGGPDAARSGGSAAAAPPAGARAGRGVALGRRNDRGAPQSYPAVRTPVRPRRRRPPAGVASGSGSRSRAPSPSTPPAPPGLRAGHRAMYRCRRAAPSPMPSAPPAEPAPRPDAATLAVLLIGPAGAGKTSVAEHWADHRRVPTAHISLDDVREWVRSGFADPQSGWNDHSEAQYRLARRTCGFAARNFLANGISCILDDAVFPDRPVVGLGGWKRHVGPGLLPVVLLPGLEIVLERNAERCGNRRAHRRGGRPHPRPDGRLVRLGPADHRQLPARRRHDGAGAGRRTGPVASPARRSW